MRNNLERYLAFADAMRVRRYHTQSRIHEETIGQHTTDVSFLCMLIAGADCTLNLLQAAILHDVGEVFTGDIPSTAKWGYPELKSILDKCETEYVNDYGLVSPDLTEKEKSILKEADLFSMLFSSAHEFDLGNKRAKVIIQRVKQVMSKRQLSTAGLELIRHFDNY